MTFSRDESQSTFDGRKARLTFEIISRDEFRSGFISGKYFECRTCFAPAHPKVYARCVRKPAPLRCVLNPNLMHPLPVHMDCAANLMIAPSAHLEERAFSIFN